jgi:hypothetical protein
MPVGAPVPAGRKVLSNQRLRAAAPGTVGGRVSSRHGTGGDRVSLLWCPGASIESEGGARQLAAPSRVVANPARAVI